MWTAICYIWTASSLIVHNLYGEIRPGRSESHYVTAGRIAGAVIILGGILFANYYQDVFSLLKFAWEIPIIFAATVWVAMYWRRATRVAAWISVGVSALIFFVLPAVLPTMLTGLRTDPQFLAVTRTEETLRRFEARELDVARRMEQIERWEREYEPGKNDPGKPADLRLGEMMEVRVKPPGKAIYWTMGVRQEGVRKGLGFFNWEMVLLAATGLELERLSSPMVETLRLPLRILLPILLMVLVSLFTTPVELGHVIRFYAKMKTPVLADPDADKRELELSYRDPGRFDHSKLFPGSQLEFTRWTRQDLLGFLGGIICALLVIAMTLLVAGVGG